MLFLLVLQNLQFLWSAYSTCVRQQVHHRVFTRLWRPAVARRRFQQPENVDCDLFGQDHCIYDNRRHFTAQVQDAQTSDKLFEHFKSNPLTEKINFLDSQCLGDFELPPAIIFLHCSAPDLKLAICLRSSPRRVPHSWINF